MSLPGSAVSKSIYCQKGSCTVPSGGQTLEHQHLYHGSNMFFPLSLPYVFHFHLSDILNADTDRSANS